MNICIIFWILLANLTELVAKIEIRMRSRTIYTANTIKVRSTWRAISNLRILLLILFINSNPFAFRSSIIDEIWSSGHICLIHSSLWLLTRMFIYTENSSRWTTLTFKSIKWKLLTRRATDTFRPIIKWSIIRAWWRLRGSAGIVDSLPSTLWISWCPISIIEIRIVFSCYATICGLIVS